MVLARHGLEFNGQRFDADRRGGNAGKRDTSGQANRHESGRAHHREQDGEHPAKMAAMAHGGRGWGRRFHGYSPPTAGSRQNFIDGLGFT
jgi:hypothetical protein